MIKKKIIIATSSGIDSTFCLTLLKKKKFQITAIYMKNWNSLNINCKQKEEINLMKKICKKRKTKLLIFNFTIEYWANVFKKIIKKFQQGQTPNPDVLCNKEIKFKILIQNTTIKHKKTLVATGHYAKITKINNQYILNIPKDKKKDQTYFLYAIEYKKLKKIIFPLESHLKKNVRMSVKKKKFENYDKKSSTGICFIEEKKFTNFLQTYLNKKIGQINDEKGNLLGTHVGIPFYTIGQKNNLFTYKSRNKNQFYTINKNKTKNKITVTRMNKNLILSNCLITMYVKKLILKISPTNKINCKNRYQQTFQKCLLYIKKKNILIYYYKKQKFITPGQHCVFYLTNTCLGGGVIKF